MILSSEKANADDGADKSLSRTTLQPITQPKAPTDLKPQKKRIPPSSKLKFSYKVRVILLKKQVTETQHAEEIVATADTTQSLEASKLTEEQVNHLKIAEAEKITDEVNEFGLESIGDVIFDQIMDENDQKNKAAQEKPEGPVEPSHFEYDQTKSTKHGDSDFDFGLCSMPDDDLVSLTGFETLDSADNDS
ncbi:hypothetical protein Tco_0345287 [Tanacetum coccineum]